MINVSKLHNELVAAGFAIGGCDSTGRVLDVNGNEIQMLPEVKAVVDAHDPAPIAQAVVEFNLEDLVARIERLEKK